MSTECAGRHPSTDKELTRFQRPPSDLPESASRFCCLCPLEKAAGGGHSRQKPPGPGPGSLPPTWRTIPEPLGQGPSQRSSAPSGGWRKGQLPARLPRKESLGNGEHLSMPQAAQSPSPFRGHRTLRRAPVQSSVERKQTFRLTGIVSNSHNVMERCT